MHTFPNSHEKPPQRGLNFWCSFIPGIQRGTMKSQKSPFGEWLFAQGYNFLTKRAKIKKKGRYVKKTSPSPALSIIPVAKGRNFLCCVTPVPYGGWWNATTVHHQSEAFEKVLKKPSLKSHLAAPSGWFMGQLIAAVRRAESTAVVVATSKWSAMIGVVSECQSIKLELLAKQRMHRPNSTNRLERSTDGHCQTDAIVSEKKREKKRKSLQKVLKDQLIFLTYSQMTQRTLESNHPAILPLTSRPPSELQLHSSRVAETSLSNILPTRGGIWRVSLYFNSLQKEDETFFHPLFYFLPGRCFLQYCHLFALEDDDVEATSSRKLDWDWAIAVATEGGVTREARSLIRQTETMTRSRDEDGACHQLFASLWLWDALQKKKADSHSNVHHTKGVSSCRDRTEGLNPANGFLSTDADWSSQFLIIGWNLIHPGLQRQNH